MIFAELGLVDLFGAFIGFVLTLCVFSYIIGDNLLFRFAIHVFVGVAAAYAAVMAWYNVIWPQLLSPLFFAGQVVLFIPLLMSGLLMAKAFPRFSGLGSPVMAYLVGVGAAAAIGGAVLGTIFPQVEASANLFDLESILQGGDFLGLTTQLANRGIVLVGTVTTLVYFHFGVRSQQGSAQRPLWLQLLSWVGQAFIAVTFGVLFAGVYAAALTALIERLDFLVDFIFALVFPGS